MVDTHSNQRVVGGSKAEELISRAAIRDVFKRKMYSQLPANNLLDSLEVHNPYNIGRVHMILWSCLPQLQTSVLFPDIYGKYKDQFTL